jgi:hypothetical protein
MYATQLSIPNLHSSIILVLRDDKPFNSFDSSSFFFFKQSPPDSLVVSQTINQPVIVRRNTPQQFNLKTNWETGGFMDSRKNKITFSGVEAPAWHYAKVSEHSDIPSFPNKAEQDVSAHKKVKLSCREP